MLCLEGPVSGLVLCLIVLQILLCAAIILPPTSSPTWVTNSLRINSPATQVKVSTLQLSREGVITASAQERLVSVLPTSASSDGPDMETIFKSPSSSSISLTRQTMPGASSSTRPSSTQVVSVPELTSPTPIDVQSTTLVTASAIPSASTAVPQVKESSTSHDNPEPVASRMAFPIPTTIPHTEAVVPIGTSSMTFTQGRPQIIGTSTFTPGGPSFATASHTISIASNGVLLDGTSWIPFSTFIQDPAITTFQRADFTLAGQTFTASRPVSDTWYVLLDNGQYLSVGGAAAGIANESVSLASEGLLVMNPTGTETVPMQAVVATAAGAGVETHANLATREISGSCGLVKTLIVGGIAAVVVCWSMVV